VKGCYFKELNRVIIKIINKLIIKNKG